MSEEKTLMFNFADEDAFRKALRQPPKEGFVEVREMGGGRSTKYLPVPVIEATADFFYRSWTVTKTDIKQLVNEVIVTVEINAYPDYPDAFPEILTGSASTAIQVNSGAKVHEFPMGKKTNALEYCMPSARAAAIGCAFETRGNVFGRNVGRKMKNGGKDVDLPENFNFYVPLKKK